MRCKPIETDPVLAQRLKESIEAVNRMTPEEREEMYKAQRESWVRGEMGWPKPKYKMVDGVKVYESYEDYCAG